MSHSYRILVAEDDKEINALLIRLLKDNGYKPTGVFTGLEALDAASRADYDLILLDIMLPYKSGDEVLRHVRETSNIPVIILTAKDLVQTKVALLRLGADDYITKPFDVDEVLARVEATLRRSVDPVVEKSSLVHMDIELDTAAKRVLVNGGRVELTAKEYRILELMLRYPKKVFSKANLFESVWGEDYLGDENTLNVHMSKLRGKLKAAGGREYIETLWGLGYRLCETENECRSRN
jgi:DNA-binding response OmpR family regulator